MTDVGAHQFVKSSNKPDRILVPQPSDSPRDPLVSPILVAAVTFAQGMSHLALAPVFPHLMEAFDSNHASVVQFAGVSSAYNTLYFTFYFGSFMVGQCLSGPMAEHIGWRSFCWLNIALQGCVLVLLIFFPETKLHRVQTKAMLEGSTTIERDPYLGQRLPFHSVVQHLPVKTAPLFWTVSSYLTVNLTQSQAFAASPYNSSQTICFLNLATSIGAFIGLATNGVLSDWILRRATKRNRGIKEPEMRLPTMIPYSSLRFTAAGIQVAAFPGIASTYAVDSYKPVAGSLFVTITINKDVWRYRFSKFIMPWIESDSYPPSIMLNTCLIAL
ncbi:hypothetical protein M432DRAFT_664577 [Thermoascus aurantiacus ATCC 26904]